MYSRYGALQKRLIERTRCVYRAARDAHLRIACAPRGVQYRVSRAHRGADPRPSRLSSLVSLLRTEDDGLEDGQGWSWQKGSTRGEQQGALPVLQCAGWEGEGPRAICQWVRHRVHAREMLPCSVAAQAAQLWCWDQRWLR